MGKKPIIIGVLIAVFSLVMVACTPGAGAGGSTTLNVTLTDFKYEPAEWRVPAGQEVTLNLKNDGAVEHDWVLFVKPVTPPASEDSPDVIFDADVEAGETKTVTFTAPSTAGEYQVVCVIPGHMEAGMTGKLVVTAP